MMQALTIQQFALIENLELEFGSGFHVLTGETGAGKSIIIDALNLALGGRASDEFIRSGEKESQVHVLFDLAKIPSLQDKLAEGGYPREGELLLSRHISLTGPNKSYVNGRPATLRLLREMGSYLVEIHGQHHHQALLRRENHLEFLDSFGGEDLLQLKEETKDLFCTWQDAKKRLRVFQEKKEEGQQRIDLLIFQLQEIDRANLALGEEEDLRYRKKKLIGAQRLKEEATASFQLLEGEGVEEEPILSSLGHVKSLLEGLKEIDDELREVYALAQTSYLQLKEATFLLRDYLDRLDLDPKELQDVEERLMEIHALKRKYGSSIEAILKFRDEMEEELEDLQGREESHESLAQEVAALKKEHTEKAMGLRKERKKAAKRLERDIISILRGLKMERVRFAVSFEELEEPKIYGLEQVEFLISPNPGEDLKPLQKIASGGELSRIMLAFKASLAHLDEIVTLIFDEIDTGVGGETAHSIGEKMAALAMDHQVICVTHLPQIASMADRHICIEKEVMKGRTIIALKELSDEERIQELARMLGAREMTATTLSHAEELYSQAKKKKEAIRG